jgi:hypothetical protein
LRLKKVLRVAFLSDSGDVVVVQLAGDDLQ